MVASRGVEVENNTQKGSFPLPYVNRISKAYFCTVQKIHIGF
jgi:hypothetical protein